MRYAKVRFARVPEGWEVYDLNDGTIKIVPEGEIPEWAEEAITLLRVIGEGDIPGIGGRWEKGDVFYLTKRGEL